MKLFLHIGTEKTGSSFLQTLLAKNRGELAKNGIFFPKAGNRENDMISGRISPGNAKDICSAFENGNHELIRSKIDLHKKNAQKLGCNKILLSNENLIRVLSDNNNLKLFEKICVENEVEWSDLLLILRDPVDQALSLYKHRAKNGKICNLQDWLKNEYTLPLYLDNFLEHIKYIDVNVTIRKYKRDTPSMEKIMFEDWLGIETPKRTIINDRINPSLTISELLLIKKVSKKNPDLVNPLYNNLLEIPVEDKDIDERLEGYFRYNIWKKIYEYKMIWEKYNQSFLGDEELTINLKKKAQTEEREILSFSTRQMEQIVDVLTDEGLKDGKLAKMIKIMKIKLSRFLNGNRN